MKRKFLRHTFAVIMAAIMLSGNVPHGRSPFPTFPGVPFRCSPVVCHK